ncbi:MAG: hypothetical protein Q4G07_09500, partial [Oscillospiraceae bacterium]|nr:hypothetical protein [Oscillospiraceae bacterium]
MRKSFENVPRGTHPPFIKDMWFSVFIPVYQIKLLFEVPCSTWNIFKACPSFPFEDKLFQKKQTPFYKAAPRFLGARCT